MDIKQKAANARTLLANETFKEVLDNIKNDQIKVFLNSSVSDTAVREEAHSIVNAINKMSTISNHVLMTRKCLIKKLTN